MTGKIEEVFLGRHQHASKLITCVSLRALGNCSQAHSNKTHVQDRAPVSEIVTKKTSLNKGPIMTYYLETTALMTMFE